MNYLYILSQNVNNDYDTYDKVLICAETPKEALAVLDSEYLFDEYSWVTDNNDVIITLVGIAASEVAKGTVFESFRAG